MAQRGTPISVELIRRIQRAAEATPIKQTARAIGVARNTVRKYIRKPVS